MNDETDTAQAEGEVLPKSFAKTAEAAVLSLEQRVLAALDRWYEKHFHAAAADGRAPISAEEKASLTAHVSEALTPKE